jgi:hypothetical protein
MCPNPEEESVDGGLSVEIQSSSTVEHIPWKMF